MANQNNEAVERRISARLVEEGYVRLQEQMQKYRQAQNQGNRAAGIKPDTDPVIMLQDAVETFFHVVRPYVEHEPRLSEYWRGAIADYPGEAFQSPDRAAAYFSQQSIGVWQVQQHTRAVEQTPDPQQQQISPGNALADGGELPSADKLHKILNLPQTVRVLYAEEAFDDEEFNGVYYIEGRFSVVGLQNVKDWEVTTKQTRMQGDGFMAGQTSTREVRSPEARQKVETAAEMLVDVAEELNMIASYEPSGNRVHGTPVPDS